MKSLFFFIALFYSINCYSQTLALDISVPQPRLGETFSLSFSSDTLSKQIFILPPAKFKVNSYMASSGQETSMTVQLEALKIGPNEIGPLIFHFNGKTYKTNVIKFTVADSLPVVNNGIWFRKVPVNDTTVYIIIDQRLATHEVVTRKDSNTINMTGEVNNNEKEAALKTENIDNARIEEWGSSSQTGLQIDNHGLSYASFYKCYKVTILNKSNPLILDKQTFVNLPNDYQFQNIKVN